MNILLIYPEFPDTFWSFKHALKFIHKKASSPPLGLLTVAAMLPQNWDIQLIDLNVENLKEKNIAWADYIFISGMTVQKESARQIISRCKKANRKIVAGGPLFAGEYEQFDEVDHFVLGEAELTLPQFLSDLENGIPKRIYATNDHADIHETPPPRWDLIKFKRYATMNIQFSRGCPYHCDFCNVTALFGHRPRLKSIEQVTMELNHLYDLGWRGGIFFVDDNFIGNKKYLKDKLLPALIAWQKKKSGITFHTEVSINIADDEQLMNMMVAAGFDVVFIGIETPEESSLIECSKTQNRNRNLIADVKRIQRAGLQVQGGFIVGFDNDSPSIFQRQIDFIQKSGIVTAMVGLLQAPIGTKLYERLKKEGRILGHMTGDNVDGSTNIIPKMNFQKLFEGYKEILQHIYSPKNYYKRIIVFLKEYEPAKIKTPIKFLEIVAFFRSVFQLGLVGKERIHYWKLMFWTQFRCRRSFPLAVTLAIYGYHFRKICELHIYN